MMHSTSSLNHDSWEEIFLDAKEHLLKDWCIDRLIYRTKVMLQKQLCSADFSFTGAESMEESDQTAGSSKDEDLTMSPIEQVEIETKKNASLSSYYDELIKSAIKESLQSSPKNMDITSSMKIVEESIIGKLGSRESLFTLFPPINTALNVLSQLRLSKSAPESILDLENVLLELMEKSFAEEFSKIVSRKENRFLATIDTEYGISSMNSKRSIILESLKRLLFLWINYTMAKIYLGDDFSKVHINIPKLQELIWKEFILELCHFLLFSPPASPPQHFLATDPTTEATKEHKNITYPSKYPLIVKDVISSVLSHKEDLSWFGLVMVGIIHNNLVIQENIIIKT
jgi:hypothetical protein